MEFDAAPLRLASCHSKASPAGTEATSVPAMKREPATSNDPPRLEHLRSPDTVQLRGCKRLWSTRIEWRQRDPGRLPRAGTYESFCSKRGHRETFDSSREDRSCLSRARCLEQNR